MAVWTSVVTDPPKALISAEKGEPSMPVKRITGMDEHLRLDAPLLLRRVTRVDTDGDVDIADDEVGEAGSIRLTKWGSDVVLDDADDELWLIG